MVTATKDSNSSSNSLDSMVKSFTSNTNFASKSASEVTKTLNNSYTSRKDDFKNVLKSKVIIRIMRIMDMYLLQIKNKIQLKLKILIRIQKN